MGEVTSILPLTVHEECIAALTQALERASEHNLTGVLIITHSENGLGCAHNESLRADGAVALCEAVKHANVRRLLGDFE